MKVKLVDPVTSELVHAATPRVFGGSIVLVLIVKPRTLPWSSCGVHAACCVAVGFVESWEEGATEGGLCGGSFL